MEPRTRPVAGGRPTRTRLTADDRKALILTAAAEVFGESGYQRGKMSEVARRVGVSEPVVFQNFGSKAALYALVVTAAADRMSAGLREAAAQQPTIGAWLRDFLAPEHLTAIHDQGSVGGLLADALGVPSEPAVAEAARNATQTLAQTLVDLFAQGQQDGSIRGDLDPGTAAWWLLPLFASQHFRFAAAPDPQALEAEMASATLRLIVNA